MIDTTDILKHSHHGAHTPRFDCVEVSLDVTDSKPNRVGLWFYQLVAADLVRAKACQAEAIMFMTNKFFSCHIVRGLSYLVHLRLYDVRQLDEGSFFAW